MSGARQSTASGGALDGLDRLDWDSFWDLSTPSAAAEIMTGTYGTRATLAAADCAKTARWDGRDEDYRFWVAVLAHLTATQRVGRRRAAVSPRTGPHRSSGCAVALAFLVRLYGGDRWGLLAMLARRAAFLRRYGTQEDLQFLIELQCAARGPGGSEPPTAEHVTLQAGLSEGFRSGIAEDFDMAAIQQEPDRKA